MSTCYCSSAPLHPWAPLGGPFLHSPPPILTAGDRINPELSPKKASFCQTRLAPSATHPALKPQRVSVQKPLVHKADLDQGLTPPVTEKVLYQPELEGSPVTLIWRLGDRSF
ncbi:mCG145279 [Mus musculus]|nr:mCG145279 [Mus musculus]